MRKKFAEEIMAYFPIVAHWVFNRTRTDSLTQLGLTRIPMTLTPEQLLCHFYPERAPADIEFWRR
jgi:hypothetical protein